MIDQRRTAAEANTVQISSPRSPDLSAEKSGGHTAPAIRHIMHRYFAVWWVYSFGGGFLFGVYPLFLRARGLNQLQMNSVLATYFTVTFLTDVPTGGGREHLPRLRSTRPSGR